LWYIPQAACDLIDLERDRTAVAHSVVSSIQERCRRAESVNDFHAVGEAKRRKLSVHIVRIAIKLFEICVCLRRAVEAMVAAAEVEAKTLLGNNVPSLISRLLSAELLLGTIRSFGTVAAGPSRSVAEEFNANFFPQGNLC